MGDFALFGFDEEGRCLVRAAGYPTIGDAQSDAERILEGRDDDSIVKFQIATNVGGPVVELGTVDVAAKTIDWVFI